MTGPWKDILVAALVGAVLGLAAVAYELAARARQARAAAASHPATD